MKMGSDVNYNGIALSLNLVSSHEKSFIYVLEACRSDAFSAIFLRHHRDFDMLSEQIGIAEDFFVFT